MTRFGFRRTIFISDLVDRGQAPRGGIAGSLRYCQQLFPKFDCRDRQYVISALPILRGDVFGDDYRASFNLAVARQS
jgi:hypothetical protein